MDTASDLPNRKVISKLQFKELRKKNNLLFGQEYLKSDVALPVKNQETSLKAQIREANKANPPFNLFRKCNLNFLQRVRFPISESLYFGINLLAFNPRNPSVDRFGLALMYQTEANVIMTGEISTGTVNQLEATFFKAYSNQIHLGMALKYMIVGSLTKNTLTLHLNRNNKVGGHVQVGSANSVGMSIRDNFSTNGQIYVNPSLSLTRNFKLNEKIDFGGELKYEKRSLYIRIGSSFRRAFNKLRVAVEVKLAKAWKVITSIDLIGEHFVLYIGFRKKSFSIKVPLWWGKHGFRHTKVLIWGSPFIVSGLLLLLNSPRFRNSSLFKATKHAEAEKQSSVHKRQTELRLISKLAADIYTREVQKKGLLILESFYGESKAVRALAASEDKLRFLHEHPSEKEKIFDITVPMRFLVNKNSRLDIFNKDKSTLIGFPPAGAFTDPSETIAIYVKYSYADIISEKVFGARDVINLPS